MRQLLSSVGRLLHWWWCSDRIRVSPREGRWLRLTPGCLVRVAGEPARVISRQIARCADGLFLAHQCEGAADSFELTVRLSSGGVALRIRRDGRDRAIGEVDVEVVPAAGVACSRRSSSCASRPWR